MNRYRNAPTLRRSDKATANTLCQKCLKRDIFDCKAPSQERPYIPRPSRTQQLQNPELLPKLSSDNPNELLKKEGLADELLANREEERGRKRQLEDMTDRHAHSPKRSRSISVETISTNRSYDSSPRRSEHGARDSGHRDNSTSPTKSRKRRYSDSTEGRSSPVQPGPRNRSPSREQTDDRNTRRRHRESSPEERGRHRGGAGRHSERRDRRSKSVDKERMKDRRSMTPDIPRDRSYRDRENPPRQSHSGRPRPDPKTHNQPPRERSLSPFSKRLRLTEAMNHGR